MGPVHQRNTHKLRVGLHVRLDGDSFVVGSLESRPNKVGQTSIKEVFKTRN